MSFWRKLYYGFRVGLGIATKLQEAGIVRIKELPKVTKVVEIIEAEVAKKR